MADGQYTDYWEFREDLIADHAEWCRMLGRLHSRKGCRANRELFDLIGVWMEKHRLLVEEIANKTEWYLTPPSSPESGCGETEAGPDAAS